MQCTSVSTARNPANLISKESNLVGQQKPQFGMVAKEKLSIPYQSLDLIKNSDEFINFNKERIFKIIKDENPELLSDSNKNDNS